MAVSAKPILTLLVVADYTVFLDLLAQALGAEPDIKIVATACDATSAGAAWRRHRPAVTLIDLRVLGGDGLGTLQQIRSLDASARVLVFTSADQRRDTAAAIKAGATGCISQVMHYEDMLAAIRKAHGEGRRAGRAATAAHPDGEAGRADGEPGRELTSRELEVLLLLRDGLSQDQISRRLAIADRTVRVHILSLKDKLAAASTVQCVAKAYELRILRP